ncbi:MAG TPA: PAS domain S-box protein, partial [Acidimicrobiales bacterium]|nr:PAS domain S-box protein [Acidimicrobiales bacterium]
MMSGDHGEWPGRAVTGSGGLAEETPPAGVFFAVVDSTGRLMALSDALESHLGYEPRHLAGSRAMRIFPQEDLDRLVETMDEKEALDVPFSGRIIHIDGRIERMDLMATLLCGSSGPCGMLIHSTDQVPAAQVDEQVERSRRRLRALFHNAPVVISVVGRDGFWLESNDAGTRMLGYPRGFDPEGGIFSLLHEDDVAVAQQALGELLDGTRSPTEPVELRAKAADGDWHTFESFGQNLLDDDAVGGIVVWAHDVTERKRVEELLRASEERFRCLAEAATEGVSIVEDGIVISANPSFAEMYGYRPNEVIGLPVTAFLTPEVNEEVLSTIEKTEPITREYWALRKDGGRFLVRTTGHSIVYRGSTVRVTTHTDLTEQLQIAALHERRRLARDLHDGLAHELALMVAKTGSLLRDDPDSPVLKELVSASERALDEARRAISVLSTANAEPLAHGLAQTVEDVANRHRMLPHIDVTNAIDLPADICEELLRIVREAMTNAARHGFASEVWVRLWRDDEVHLTIEDNGRGFEIDRTHSRGFGLVSMQERAAAIGATFFLDSAPGVGTRIEIVVATSSTISS